MGALPKSHLKSNAVTDVDLTAFFATGRLDAVRIPSALGLVPTPRSRETSDIPVG